jgi:tetratricopeptide (TPR) repeat protein
VGPKGPHTLLSGTYYLDGEDLVLQARLTDYDTGESVYVFEPIIGSPVEASAALDDLAEHVAAAMGVHWHARRDLRIMTPPSSIAALETKAKANSLLSTGKHEEALVAYDEALELDPRYFYAWIEKVRTLQELGRHEEAERQMASAGERFDALTPFENAYFAFIEAAGRGHQPSRLAAAARMAEIAPQLNWVQYNLVFMTLQVNRPREALEIVNRTPNVFFGHLPLEAHHALREFDQELEGARLLVKTHPTQGLYYLHEASALAALGRTAELEGVIERCVSVQLDEDPYFWRAGDVILAAALELRAHGHREESDTMALRAVDWFDRRAARMDIESRSPMDLRIHSTALRLVGRFEDARTLLVELGERRYPDSSFMMTGLLGLVAAQTGDQVEARRVFADLAEEDGRGLEGLVSALRACIAAHLGEKDLAVEMLRQAYAEGFSHGSWVHCDPNLEPLWDYPPFQELIAPKG